jgi:chromosome segregation ATPase
MSDLDEDSVQDILLMAEETADVITLGCFTVRELCEGWLEKGFWEEERRKAAEAEFKRAEQLGAAEGACKRLRLSLESRQAAGLRLFHEAQELIGHLETSHADIDRLRGERDQARSELAQLRAPFRSAMTPEHLEQLSDTEAMIPARDAINELCAEIKRWERAALDARDKHSMIFLARQRNDALDKCDVLEETIALLEKEAALLRRNRGGA